MHMSLIEPGSAAEERRLAVLNALTILPGEPDAAFESLVALAAETLGCPTAMLNLVDRDVVWVKARTGEGPKAVPRSISFCDHAVRDDRLTVVENAPLDRRFAENPFVCGADPIIFYAGMPIRARTDDGESHPVGVLCVIDGTPRSLNERERAALANLAIVAEALITARTNTRQAVSLAVASQDQSAALLRKDQIFRQAERMARMGSWRVNLADNHLEWSEGVLRIHDLPLDSKPDVANAISFYAPEHRRLIEEALARLVETGEPFDVEADFVSARGVTKRVRSIGELERVDGEAVGIVGLFRDVSDEYALSNALRLSADTDSLTKIFNRGAFNRSLGEAMARSAESGAPLALVLVDLDAFKMVNDTLGHVAGDDVLREVAQRLRQPWLQDSPAFRLGGDEFALIVTDEALIAAHGRLRARLEAELCVPVTSSGLTIATGGSVGVAIFDPSFTTQRAFIHQADAALYRAKRARVGDRRIRA